MKKPDPRIYLLIAFILNVLQSIFMPITEDEAYYWMYAQRLDWGYFDHPPMVAVMIWLGDRFFTGTLGVRVVTNLAWLLMVFALWYLIPVDDRKKEYSLLYFVLLVLAMPLVNLYGFITTPDTPLLLFTVVYLLLFKQYIEYKNIKNAFLLGISAALLLYSKYHGVLVIGFSLIAYPGLFLKRSFYLFVLTGIVMFVPHLLWQYHHDFISIRYHLLYRTENELRLVNIVNYVVNTFVVLNPLFFGMFLYFLIKKPVRIKFPFHYYMLIWGGIAFFGLSAFRDHVEPHWIAFTVIPLSVMIHKIVLNDDSLKRFFKAGALLSILLLVTIRIAFMLPEPWNPLPDQRKDYYSEIHNLADGDRVAFINSYHGAAKYSFYTGEDAFSYNCMPYGKKQYDFWPYEKTYQGTTVFLVGDWPSWYLDTLRMKTGDTLFYKRVKDFQVLSRVHAEVIKFPHPVISGAVEKFRIRIDNPYDYALEFKSGELPLQVELFFFKGRDYDHFIALSSEVEQIPPGSSGIVNGTFEVDLEPGYYKLGIALRPGDLTAVPVAPRIGVEVAR